MPEEVVLSKSQRRRRRRRGKKAQEQVVIEAPLIDGRRQTQLAAQSHPPATQTVVQITNKTKSKRGKKTVVSPVRHRISELVRKLGDTPIGVGWALQALHPCDEEHAGAYPIPDFSSTPTATPEFRLYTSVVEPAPAGEDREYDMSFGLGAGSSTELDVEFMFLPFLEVPALYRLYKSGATTKGNFTPLVFPQLNPTETGTKQTSFAYATTVRGTHKGITLELDASQMYNQGTVYAAQWAVQPRRDKVVKNSWFSVDSEVFQVPTPPFTESGLFSMDPKMVRMPAKDGCYLPLRFRQPVHEFTDSNDIRKLYFYDSNDRDETGAILGDTTKMLTVTPPQNFNVGVVVFKGISKQASIRVKIRQGMEVVPRMNSLTSLYVNDSAPYDDQALKAVNIVSQQTAHAYPASYNDLGEILNTVASVLTGPVKGIAGVLGNAGIPVISDIAKVVHGVADTAQKVLGAIK